MTAVGPPGDGGAAGGGASGEASGSASDSGGASDTGGSGMTAPSGTTIPGVGGIVDAAAAADGGRYLVSADGLSGTNTTVTRLGPNGTVQWQRTFRNGDESRRPVAVVGGEGSGAYLLEILGVRTGPEAPETTPKLRLHRVTPDGDVVWNRSLGNATGVYGGPPLVATGDGVAVARGMETEDDPRATRVTRLTAGGSVAWDRAYRGGVPRALAETPDGHLLVAGEHDFGEGWLLRLENGGAKTFNETFGTGSERRIVGVRATDDGGALVAGTAETRGFSGSDPWVARVDDSGAVRWSRTYGTVDREFPRTAVPTDAGILLVSSRDTGGGERPTVLTHVATDGDVGSRTVSDGPGFAAPVPTDDGRLDLYGFELDRQNRTAVGTVRTVDMPTPAAPDWPVHDTVASNETFYRGQNLGLPGDGDTTYDLYRFPTEYTEFDEPQLVRRIGGAFETATLPRGEYALRASPDFWYRVEDEDYSLVTDRETAAFTLEEQEIWRIETNRTVVETFAGERLVTARVDSTPENMTARVGLTRLDGSSAAPADLAEALAPAPDAAIDDDRLFSENGRNYGVVELAPDRNLTLDADALPAGLYELTVTGNQTADATEASTARLVVVDEQRNATLTPGNSTLTVTPNSTATANLTLSGVEDGLGAVRIDAMRRGPPVLRLDLEFTEAVDYGSARSGAGISRGRSTADTQSLDIRGTPNGSFVVARLSVRQDDFGRQDETDEAVPDENTVTVGLTYAVDTDGIPYSLTDEERLTVTVDEDGN